jgi:hypothetical protein
LYNPKIKPEHLARKAIVYLRQSSERQVRQNKESQQLQYAVAERVRALGWKQVEIINSDLGLSAGIASAQREGFERVLSLVALERSASSAAGKYRGYPAPTKTGVGCWRCVRSLERLSLTSNRSTI